jgi:uncharacterized membrane protein
MNDALRVAAPLLLTAALVAAGGCASEHFDGTKDDPLVAGIVKVGPNPVAVGDTATFTCIVVQSRPPAYFSYRWSAFS